MINKVYENGPHFMVRSRPKDFPTTPTSKLHLDMNREVNKEDKYK